MDVFVKAVPTGSTSTWSLTVSPASGSDTVPLSLTVVSLVKPPVEIAVVPSVLTWPRLVGEFGFEFAAFPAAKSLNDVKPLPVAVVDVDDEELGAVHVLGLLNLRTISDDVSGLPTRSPGLAKVKVAL